MITGEQMVYVCSFCIFLTVAANSLYNYSKILEQILKVWYTKID